MNRGALNARELKTYASKLRELDARLKGEVSQLEAEALRQPASAKNADEMPAHEADAPVRVAEEAVAMTLLGSEEQVLADVRDALARIDAGTFGKCEHCGRAITRVRLNAIPYARTCISCATHPE